MVEVLMAVILAAVVLMVDFRTLLSEIGLGGPSKDQILEILAFGRFFS